jgi:glycosyltransferase involved in cell wall biosynthesis
MKASICVRVKYPVDRLLAMILCLKRQTHEDWEAIITTDGPNDNAKQLVASFADPRLVMLETPALLGFWGHPYRNLAIKHCTGDVIGLTNDDNYYVPGYLEEMLKVFRDSNDCKMVMCDMLHREFGWSVCRCQPKITECDLGNWIAAADVVKTTPWPGNDIADDGRYVEMLAKKVGTVFKINKPLFIKN